MPTAWEFNIPSAIQLGGTENVPVISRLEVTSQQEGPGARSQSLSPEGRVSRETGEISRHQLRVCEAKSWQSGCAVLAIQSDHWYAVLEFSPKAECTQSSQNMAASLLCGSNAIFSLSGCGPQGILWCCENLLFYWNKQISWLFCSRLAWNQISCPRESRCYYHFTNKEMEKSERQVFLKLDEFQTTSKNILSSKLRITSSLSND